MNLKDCKEAYYCFSEKTSNISRQLAFAGIAIIWIFRQSNGVVPVCPKNLLPPLMLFSSTLALDLAHYAYGSIAWGIIHRCKEKQKIKDNDCFEGDFLVSKYINWPTNAFFWLKIAAVGIGYFLLIKFLIEIWYK